MWRARSEFVLFATLHGWSGKCASIQFSVWRERQRVNGDKIIGHHVFGQRLRQSSKQALCFGCFFIVLDNQIGNQLLITAEFARNDGDLAQLFGLLE